MALYPNDFIKFHTSVFCSVNGSSAKWPIIMMHVSSAKQYFFPFSKNPFPALNSECTDAEG
jgi:hypothetical protein